MEFGNPSLSLLTKNTKQESETFTESVQKLMAVHDMTKSLYGPNSKYILLSGSKMMLTSQMQTIFANIPPTHPVQKVLADYINKMTLLGDGSTFMVNLTCILTKNIAILVQKGMKKVEINRILNNIKRNIGSYKFQTTETDLTVNEDAQKILKGILKNDELTRVMSDAISILSKDKNTDFIKELDDRLRILKIGTGTLNESYAMQGMVFKGEPVTIKKEGQNLNTAIFNCPIEPSKTITKGTVVFDKADELLNFSTDELEETKKLATKLTKNNKLLFCNGKIEDSYLDEINATDCIAFNIFSKHDIRRIRNLFGGCISPVLREVKENENCSKVSVFEDCNTKYTRFEGKGFVSTIVVRNSIVFMLDECERLLQKVITLIMKNASTKFELVGGSGGFENEMIANLKEEIKSAKGYETLVYTAVIDALNEVAIKEKAEDIYDILSIKLKAVKYTIETCELILTTDDYYFVRTSEMNIKPRGPGMRDI